MSAGACANDATQIDRLTLQFPTTLRNILRKIDDGGAGVVFFVDSERTLLGVISDGDIRRDLLNGLTLEEEISKDSRWFNVKPYTAKQNVQLSELWKILNSGVSVVPIVDDDNRVIDFASKDKIRNIPILEPSIGNQEIVNLIECANSGWISSQGPFIAEFERLFNQYFNVGDCSVAVSNGTVALHLALATLGIGPGDEVLVPNFTFAASINAIIHAGATPVLIDIDPETWTIDMEGVRKSFSESTKAIMPVHIYGQPAHIDEISNFARINNLLVIEDCAESLGATYKERRVGLDGDCGCFSFFANKVITTGEGGMLLFRDPEKAAHARILRDHGMSANKKYWHEYAGFNFRMTNMQAAIGVAQMARIDDFRMQRKDIFSLYRKNLVDHPLVEFMPRNAWSENSYWLFTIRIRGVNEKVRDGIIKKMSLRGIDARPGFYPLHLMSPYERFGNKSGYPASIAISANMISLPSSSNLKKNDISYISNSLIDVLKEIN